MKTRDIIVIVGMMSVLGNSALIVEADFTDEEIISEVVENILYSMDNLDKAYGIYQDALADSRAFVSDEISWAELTDRLRYHKEKIGKLTFTDESEELKLATVQSDLFTESLTAAEFAKGMRDSMMSDFENIGDILAGNKESDKLYEQNVCEKLLEIYEKDVQLYLDLFWYTVNEYLIDITEEEAVQRLCENMKEYPAFEHLDGSWTTDYSQLSAVEELCWTQLEDNVEEWEVLIGDASLSLAEMEQDAEQLEQQYREFLMEKYSFDEEEAMKYIELKRMEQELELLKEDMRQKFAPLEENNSPELFQKAAKFAASNMYEDAYQCIDMFLRKDPDPECPYFCGEAVKIFFQEQEAGSEYKHGIVVTMLYPEAVGGYFEAGDIIIKINDIMLESVEDYGRSSTEERESDQIMILRMNAEQKLEKVLLTVPTDVSILFEGIFL